ncbi:hypothetical protein ACVMHZ_008239 [Bradyrhizobium liaoningense]
MSRLKRDNPALLARDQLKYEKIERALPTAWHSAPAPSRTDRRRGSSP